MLTKTAVRAEAERRCVRVRFSDELHGCRVQGIARDRPDALFAHAGEDLHLLEQRCVPQPVGGRESRRLGLVFFAQEPQQRPICRVPKHRHPIEEASRPLIQHLVPNGLEQEVALELLVLLRVRGVDALHQELARTGADTPTILLTGYGDIPTSVRAMKAGALDFLTKPYEDDDLLAAVRRAVSRRDGSSESTCERRPIMTSDAARDEMHWAVWSDEPKIQSSMD